ncbi:MAG TPA: RidA family protein [Telmatospirillum sp.]|nr:RidA family protein [Telmatospirillum sp.]
MERPENPEIDRILTPSAPSPAGHYSQATAWSDLLFVSGQLPVRPDGGDTVDRPFDEQAAQALANLQEILIAAGSGFDRVLKVTAYIVGVDHWPAFNRMYAELFGDARPARSVVPVPALHHGYLVEIDAIALAGGAVATRKGNDHGAV